MSRYGTTKLYEPNQFRMTKVTVMVDPRRKTRSGGYAATSWSWSGSLKHYQLKNVVVEQSIEWQPSDGHSINDNFLLRNRAVAGLRAQLDSFRDIAEHLAEGKETLSYFTKKVEGAVRMVRNIRKNPVAFAAKRARIIKHKIVTRKKVSRAEYMFYNRLVQKQKGKSWRERAETIPDGWLEYHFAIVPLIGTSNAIHEFFASPPMPRIKSHAVSKKPYSYTSVQGSQVMTVSVDVRKSMTMGCKIVNYNPNVALLKRVGLTSPLAVAWEVVPFSWVSDYFFNIGEMIENLANPYLGLSIRDRYTTTASRITGERSYSTPEFLIDKRKGYPVQNRGVNYGGLDGTHRSAGRLISRNTTFDLTYEFVRIPSPINVQRLSYLLSVGYNLFKGK